MSFSTHSRLFSSEYFHYKVFIHEKCLEKYNDDFQENLLQPSIIDARARWLRNTDLRYIFKDNLRAMQAVELSTSWFI
jgi:hypothetical protein